MATQNSRSNPEQQEQPRTAGAAHNPLTCEHEWRDSPSRSDLVCFKCRILKAPGGEVVEVFTYQMAHKPANHFEHLQWEDVSREYVWARLEQEYLNAGPVLAYLQNHGELNVAFSLYRASVNVAVKDGLLPASEPPDPA